MSALNTVLSVGIVALGAWLLRDGIVRDEPGFVVPGAVQVVYGVARLVWRPWDRSREEGT